MDIAENNGTDGRLSREIPRLILLMRKGGLQSRFVIWFVFLSFILSLLNLYTIYLLFPLVSGIINNDFSPVSNLRGVGFLARRYPSAFSGQVRLFFLLVIWIYTIVIVKNVVHYYTFLGSYRHVKSVTARLKDLMLERCLGFGKSFYDGNKLSALNTTLSRSTEAVMKQFLMLQESVIKTLLLGVFFVMMLRISWPLTLIAAVFFPLITVATRRLSKKIAVRAKAHREGSEKFEEKILELLHYMPLVQGFAKEDEEKRLFSAANENEVATSFREQRLLRLMSPIEDIGATTATLFVAFGMMLLIHWHADIDPAKSFVFVYLAMKIIPALNSLNWFRTETARSSPLVGKIINILDSNNDHIVRSGDTLFKEFRDQIDIRNLNFHYIENVPVLQNINLTIRKGQVTAIVGPTGSGKSTLANLLLRFYNCPANTVFVDGADICSYDTSSFRRRMSFVGQELLIFNNTVSHNLLYGCTEPADPEDVKAICRELRIDEFVSRLPLGYDTPLGERGARLSGGEKQRIALARALLRKSDILIFDEATSALDVAMESAVADAIYQRAAGKTVIVISHRLSLVKNADHFVYLDGGRALESGTLEEILGLKGHFYRQWRKQKL